MALKKLIAGEELHARGERVTSVEVVLSGSLGIHLDHSFIKLGPGAMIGMLEEPDTEYTVTYVAQEDTQVYSYDYQSEEDLAVLISSNEKLAPAIAMETVRETIAIYNAYREIYSAIEEENVVLQKDRGDYELLAVSAHRNVIEFPELGQIEPPEDYVFQAGWEMNFLTAMEEHAASIKTGFYDASVDLAIGTILMIRRLGIEALGGALELENFMRESSRITEDFRNEMRIIRMRLERQNEGQTIPEEDEIQIKNAFESIVHYSLLSREKMEEYKELMAAFKALPDRTDNTERSRQLRREVTDMFYEVYLSVFYHSMNEPMNLPMVVRMFLLFGFMDEEIAGETYTKAIYRFVRDYQPDPEGRVLTIYQWLIRIYNGQAVPSKNEFDLDYVEYLRKRRHDGELTENQMNVLLVDTEAMVEFEIKNLFRLGNRMTFGRLSVFQPIFDYQNIIVDLDRSYMSAERVHAAMDQIRSMDGSIFLREKDYNNEKAGVSNLPIHEEVLPNIILLPNVGARAAMWQPIEGRKRDTPARFLLPIFLSEDLKKTMVNACGDFRWEMTKAEQGVHWNDPTDPSLTSEYSDYIQTYRKNHDLTGEQRERLKKAIQKNGGNQRKIFVYDYMIYMNHESNSSPVMNRVARGLLFKYCPFTAEVRAKLSKNPQYTDLLAQYHSQLESKVRPIQTAIQRIEKSGQQIPEELTEELKLLKR